MAMFTLLGRVLPEGRARGTTIGPIALEWSGPSAQTKFTIEITIVDHLIHAEIQAEEARIDSQTLNYARIGVTELASSLIGIRVFVTGLPLNVLVDQVMLPGENDPKPLVLMNPDLASLVQFTGPHGDLKPFIHMLVEDYRLMQIISDAARAITDVQYQPIACGRVVDGIRNFIAPACSVKAGWAQMQASLNLTPEYIRYISHRSSRPRHRETHDLPAAEVMLVLRQTWIILDRFIQYCLGGQHPLTEPEFPVL